MTVISQNRLGLKGCESEHHVKPHLGFYVVWLCILPGTVCTCANCKYTMFNVQIYNVQIPNVQCGNTQCANTQCVCSCPQWGLARPTILSPAGTLGKKERKKKDVSKSLIQIIQKITRARQYMWPAVGLCLRHCHCICISLCDYRLSSSLSLYLCQSL